MKFKLYSKQKCSAIVRYQNSLLFGPKIFKNTLFWYSICWSLIWRNFLTFLRALFRYKFTIKVRNLPWKIMHRKVTWTELYLWKMSKDRPNENFTWWFNISCLKVTGTRLYFEYFCQKLSKVRYFGIWLYVRKRE